MSFNRLATPGTLEILGPIAHDAVKKYHGMAIQDGPLQLSALPNPDMPPPMQMPEDLIAMLITPVRIAVGKLAVVHQSRTNFVIGLPVADPLIRNESFRLIGLGYCAPEQLHVGIARFDINRQNPNRALKALAQAFGGTIPEYLAFNPTVDKTGRRVTAAKQVAATK
jgi:hypothetical protein